MPATKLQVPAMLLLATAASAYDNGNNQHGGSEVSLMFESASRLATVVKTASGLTKSSDVDKNTLKDAYICPMADNVADMTKKALEELGDSNPQGKENGMMNKLVGISRGIKNISDRQQISCDGLSNLQDQSDKVLSKIKSRRSRKRDNDDSDSDDDNDESDIDDDDDIYDDDHESFNTVEALSYTSGRTLAIMNNIGTHTSGLPSDFFCDSVDSSAKTVDEMTDKLPSNPDNRAKKWVEHTVYNGNQFTQNAEKSDKIKCDSQVSKLEKSLKNAENKAGSKSSGSSGSSSATKSASKAATSSAPKASATGSSSSRGKTTSTRTVDGSAAASATASSKKEESTAAENAAGLTSFNQQLFGGACAVAAMALL